MTKQVELVAEGGHRKVTVTATESGATAVYYRLTRRGFGKESVWVFDHEAEMKPPRRRPDGSVTDFEWFCLLAQNIVNAPPRIGGRQ